MIQGYAESTTVRPGERLVVRVSTDAPRFRIDVHRFGTSLELVERGPWLPGAWAPPHLPWQDWGRDDEAPDGRPLPAWPGYELAVGTTWRPGVHIAVLVEDGAGGDERDERDDETQPSPDARSARALFVVRAPVPTAPVLYKLPLFTYQAYNRVLPDPVDPRTGVRAWSLYDVPSGGPRGVSVRRPGGGTGGTPWDIFNPDPFDPTPRQTFVHWDARMLGWLASRGVDVDVCTDADIHADPDGAALAPYALLLSSGHDEYWSDAMRAAVTNFVDGGGNVAFLGGNTCWYRIAFDDEVSFRRVGEWSDAATARPENALTGVSYRNGGERRPEHAGVPVGYRVQHADHWVYEGTGVGDGDTFGDRPEEYLVGYECDGAHFDRAAVAAGRPAVPTGEDGTPADFTILGIGDTRPAGWGLGNGAATLGLHGRRGTVFTAATTDWPRLLAAGHPVVARVTANVLDRLGGVRGAGRGADRA